MPEFTCRYLWTGCGEPQENKTVVCNQLGMIESIHGNAPGSQWDYHFGMPAFFDAHCHFFWMVMKSLAVDLSRCRGAQDLLETVKIAAENHSGGVLRGESFDQSAWKDDTLPTLAQLDAVTGSVPAFLCRVCGHAALANTALLKLLPEDSPEINRETGMLLEKTVMGFTRRFPPDMSQMKRAMESVVKHIHSKGVTGLCTIEKPENAIAIQETNLPMDLSWVINNVDGSSSVPLNLSASMIKLFLDGSFGAESAAVCMESRDHLLYTDAELAKRLYDIFENGYMPVVHAIGGRALEQLKRVSDSVFADAGRIFPIRVEHAEDIMQTWPVLWDPACHVFSMQPNFVERWQRPGGMYDALLGEEHSISLNPFRAVLSSGFTLGFGSDSMPLDPLYGLSGAVNHRNPDFSLTMEEALRAYTLDAALISGNLPLSSPLEAGRPADLVFLNSNPFLASDHLEVCATVRRGHMVYEGVR